jgi:hypothetical protein
MISLSSEAPRVPEFAHYYGDWIWDEELTGWIKSLLLFFDGIALALPPATAERLIEANPVLAQPLAELGLLRNYEPDLWMKSLTQPPEKYEQFLDTMKSVFRRVLPGESLSERDLRDLAEVAEASDTMEDLKVAGRVYNRALEKFGDTPSRPIALAVGTTSRLLRENITDVAIQSVIDDENAASFVAAIIGSYDAGRAKVVVGDLAQVGIDLSAVPLDEVLAFRAEYGNEYRRYSNDVRRFALELSLMGEADQGSALMDRRAELTDRAERLRRTARTAFARQAISLGFGVAGAAWTLVHGDPWGAAFAAGAATAGLTTTDPGSIGAAYTYILRAKTELTR